MAEAIYQTVGPQISFYRIGGKEFPGTRLAAKTKLYLRNKECNLKEKNNVFEIADYDEDDIYIFLDAHQVEPYTED